VEGDGCGWVIREEDARDLVVRDRSSWCEGCSEGGGEE
jgi:hypothetical protein